MNDKQRISAYQKINKGLEYFWLVITIASTVMATWFIVQEGYDDAKWYLLFPLLALAMYVMRRGLRKKFEVSLKRALEEQVQKKKGKSA